MRKPYFLTLIALVFISIFSNAQNLFSTNSNSFKSTTTFFQPKKNLFPGVPIVAFFFKKHVSILDVSLGGGNYGSSSNNTKNATGNGGQSIFGINYEYALSNKFGIGAMIEFGGLGNPDLGTSFSTGLIGIKGYYHFYSTEKTTIYTSLALCHASANYNNPKRTVPKINGNGSNLQVSIGFRRQLIKQWLGCHANLSFAEYNFGTWKPDKETTTIKNDAGTENLNIKLSGINFTTGLSFRF